MKDLGQLVITDHMINRVSQNWENGVRTHIFLDEFHTLLQHKYSANFFDSAYRRFRKRNAWTTSLTAVGGTSSYFRGTDEIYHKCQSRKRTCQDRQRPGSLL